jgi:hypothetical protein
MENTQKPAVVINQVKENTLTEVHLTPEAEIRLGIETRPAVLKNMPKILTVGRDHVPSRPGC